MSHSRAWKRLLAAALIAWVAPALAAPPPASLTGRIVDAGTRAPLAGATVLLVDPTTRTSHRSNPTDGEGTFSVPALPAAAYEVAVQAAGTVHVLEGSLRMAAGQARTLELVVAQTDDPTDDGVEDPVPPQRRLATIWSKPGAATAIVLGAAVVVGIAVDQLSDDEPAASPF